MQSLRWMQKCTVYPQAVHRRLQLLSDLPTLPHSAHNQLAAIFNGLDNLRHSATEILLRELVCPVDVFQVRERSPLRRDDMDRSDHRRSIFARAGPGIDWIWWRHGQRGNGILDRRHRGRQRGRQGGGRLLLVAHKRSKGHCLSACRANSWQVHVRWMAILREMEPRCPQRWAPGVPQEEDGTEMDIRFKARRGSGRGRRLQSPSRR